MNLDTIEIVTAINDNYAQHLGVMLKSLLENKISKNKINIYIITSSLSNQNRLNLSNVLADYHLVPIFIDIDESEYSTLKVFDYIGKEMYYRIAIPNLLDKKIEKVIYLDSDIVVKEDITLLWNINIEDYYLGAVEVEYLSGRKKHLSIPKSYSYFNSGVLIINLKKWREHNITNKIIQFVKRKSKSIRFPDQDGMNATLYDKWMKLDHKWNYTTYRHSQGLPITPAIIHFTGKEKPWNSNHPLKTEYFKYYSMINWK